MTVRCAGCGRRLKRPTATGYGPVCARRLHRPARIRISRNPDQMPGQAELDLQPMQPTLWSL
ncbi:DUF6011 domain-containing protein [Streptomyces sp. NPDC085596]|uniref:DUF6011 domain-containing protein n=1 Tax=Streptomyces sp. NPDC085596 TaxID=3365731 RepID=UPI0037D0ED0B